MVSLSSLKKYFINISLVLLYTGATFPMGVAMVGVSLARPFVVSIFVILLILAMGNYLIIRVKDPMFWFIVALIVYVLTAYSIALFQDGGMDGEAVLRILRNIIPLLICFVFIDYYSHVRDNKIIWTILFFAILIIIIRSITAINAEIMFPHIARKNATGIYADDPEFGIIGAGTYPFINGLVFLVLPILYVVRNKSQLIMKIVLILTGTMSLFAIIYTAWSTALILWVCALFIGFSPKKKQYRYLYVYVLLLALFVAVNSDLIFQSFKTTFDNNPTIYSKIIDVQESLHERGVSGQVKNRQSLYLKSIEVFFSNPFLGDINSETGGHAYWFDHLARFGLIGTLPLLVSYFLLVLKSSHMASYNYRPYHYINSMILLLFGCVKNVNGYEFMLFLCIIGPLMTRLADLPSGSHLKITVAKLLKMKTKRKLVNLPHGIHFN